MRPFMPAERHFGAGVVQDCEALMLLNVESAGDDSRAGAHASRSVFPARFMQVDSNEISR